MPAHLLKSQFFHRLLYRYSPRRVLIDKIKVARDILARSVDRHHRTARKDNINLFVAQMGLDICA